MLFAVVRLRTKGRALTRAEIAAQPRAIGDLRFVAPPHAQPDDLRRPARIAELRGEAIGNIEVTIIDSLMDPASVKITADEMVIFGYEMDTIEGRRHEYSQGWLVRHLKPGERPMRRGDVPM